MCSNEYMSGFDGVPKTQQGKGIPCKVFLTTIIHDIQATSAEVTLTNKFKINSPKEHV